MLGEGGGRQADVGTRFAHAPVRTIDLPDAGEGVRDRLEKAAVAQVRVREQVGHAENRHRWHAGGLKRFSDGFLRSVLRPGGDDFVEFGLIAIAADYIGEADIAGEAGLLEHGAHGSELSVVLAGDRDPLVVAGAWAAAVRRHGGVAVGSPRTAAARALRRR